MSRRARGLSLLLACAILPAPSWSDAPAVSPRPQARIVLILEPPARPVARPVEVLAEPAGLTNPGLALETEGAFEPWPAPISESISKGPLRPQDPAGPLEVPLLLTRDGSRLLPDLRALDPATQPRGPLLSRALVPEPSARLAAQEVRARDALEISDGTAQIARMLVQNMAVGTRPERIASSIAPQPTSPPPILPAVRPVPRPTTTASPLPPGRPELRPARPLAVVPLMGTDAPTPASPEARSRAVLPPDLSALAVALALRPPERPPEITRQAQQVREQRARGAVCGSVDIQGQTLSRINGSGGCGVNNPVSITSIGGVRLSTPSTMDCTTAEALLRWVEQSARPTLADQGGGLASLRVIGHYSCRNRNGSNSPRLSEHAKGRAIDIAGFGLRNGNEISVRNGWNTQSQGQRLRRLQDDACGIFGTVLGPNANAAHRDHFHFDTARYRNGSYCR